MIPWPVILLGSMGAIIAIVGAIGSWYSSRK